MSKGSKIHPAKGLEEKNPIVHTLAEAVISRSAQLSRPKSKQDKTIKSAKDKYTTPITKMEYFLIALLADQGCIQKNDANREFLDHLSAIKSKQYPSCFQAICAYFSGQAPELAALFKVAIPPLPLTLPPAHAQSLQSMLETMLSPHLTPPEKSSDKTKYYITREGRIKSGVVFGEDKVLVDNVRAAALPGQLTHFLSSEKTKEARQVMNMLDQGKIKEAITHFNNYCHLNGPKLTTPLSIVPKNDLGDSPLAILMARGDFGDPKQGVTDIDGPTSEAMLSFMVTHGAEINHRSHYVSQMGALDPEKEGLSIFENVFMNLTFGKAQALMGIARSANLPLNVETIFTGDIQRKLNSPKFSLAEIATMPLSQLVKKEFAPYAHVDTQKIHQFALKVLEFAVEQRVRLGALDREDKNQRMPAPPSRPTPTQHFEVKGEPVHHSLAHLTIGNPVIQKADGKESKQAWGKGKEETKERPPVPSGVPLPPPPRQPIVPPLPPRRMPLQSAGKREAKADAEVKAPIFPRGKLPPKKPTPQGQIKQQSPDPKLNPIFHKAPENKDPLDTAVKTSTKILTDLGALEPGKSTKPYQHVINHLAHFIVGVSKKPGYTLESHVTNPLQAAWEKTKPSALPGQMASNKGPIPKGLEEIVKEITKIQGQDKHLR